jgi:hypothetical protein
MTLKAKMPSMNGFKLFLIFSFFTILFSIDSHGQKQTTDGEQNWELKTNINATIHNAFYNKDDFIFQSSIKNPTIMSGVNHTPLSIWTSVFDKYPHALIAQALKDANYSYFSTKPLDRMVIERLEMFANALGDTSPSLAILFEQKVNENLPQDTPKVHLLMNMHASLRSSLSQKYLLNIFTNKSNDIHLRRTALLRLSGWSNHTTALTVFQTIQNDSIFTQATNRNFLYVYVHTLDTKSRKDFLERLEASQLDLFKDIDFNTKIAARLISYKNSDNTSQYTHPYQSSPIFKSYPELIITVEQLLLERIRLDYEIDPQLKFPTIDHLLSNIKPWVSVLLPFHPESNSDSTSKAVIKKLKSLGSKDDTLNDRRILLNALASFRNAKAIDYFKKNHMNNLLDHITWHSLMWNSPIETVKLMELVLEWRINGTFATTNRDELTEMLIRGFENTETIIKSRKSEWTETMILAALKSSSDLIKNYALSRIYS